MAGGNKPIIEGNCIQLPKVILEGPRSREAPGVVHEIFDKRPVNLAKENLGHAQRSEMEAKVVIRRSREMAPSRPEGRRKRLQLLG